MKFSPTLRLPPALSVALSRAEWEGGNKSSDGIVRKERFVAFSKSQPNNKEAFDKQTIRDEESMYHIRFMPPKSFALSPSHATETEAQLGAARRRRKRRTQE